MLSGNYQIQARLLMKINELIASPTPGSRMQASKWPQQQKFKKTKWITFFCFTAARAWYFPLSSLPSFTNANLSSLLIFLRTWTYRMYAKRSIYISPPPPFLILERIHSLHQEQAKGNQGQ
jgi:hypothetical protein